MEVQLVRRHRRGVSDLQLQALRKRLMLRMDDSEGASVQLRVCVPCAGFNRPETVLLLVSRSEIKAVRIKQRLMSITLAHGDRSVL